MSNQNQWISDFLAEKQLSDNSKSAYRYDLEQFQRQIPKSIDDYQLRLYQESLNSLKPAVRKRKLSAVNQFLYFLYQKGHIDRFYKLTEATKVIPTAITADVLALEPFYQASPHEKGQLVALLILELGLRPSEILGIKLAEIDLDFDVLTVGISGQKRVLTLPKQLRPYLSQEKRKSQTYLFDKQGRPYSRQWLFIQLSTYLASCDLAEWTAQKLREQYILRERASGESMMGLAKKLGLKTPMTLEKYYKNGH